MKIENCKLKISLIIAISVFAIVGVFSASASFNPQINYQGKLTDSSSVAVTDGDYNVEFKIYTASTGGIAIWTETCTSTNAISISSGLFSHMLGSVTSLSGVDFNQSLWLGVNVGGTSTPSWDGEMSPRKKLGAVPASFEADKLDGIDSASFLRSDATDTATHALTFSSTLDLSATTTLGASANLYFAGGTTYYIDNSGNAVFNTLNIATTTISKKLTVSAGGANITGGLTTDTLTSTTSTLGTVISGTWNGTAIGTQWGGTGNNWSSIATGSLPYFISEGTMGTLGGATSTYVLQTNGIGTAPSWVALSGGGDMLKSTYDTEIDSNIDTGAGGTGQSWNTVATGSIIYFSDTGTMTTLGGATSTWVLSSGGVGVAPSWADPGVATDIYWTGTADNLVTSTARTSLGLGSLALLNSIDISDNTNISLTDDTLGLILGEIDHDSLQNFVSEEHFLQSAITEVGTIATGTWQGDAILNEYIASSTEYLADNNTDIYWTGTADNLVAATARTSLGLGAMALNPAAGSTTITTLGEITTGTWSADSILNAKIASSNRIFG